MFIFFALRRNADFPRMFGQSTFKERQERKDDKSQLYELEIRSTNKNLACGENLAIKR